MECETPIFLGLKDVFLDPIQVLEVQQYRSMPNLKIRPPVREGFEDMVVDAFSIELVHMLTKSGLVREFNGGLDLISLKDN